MTAPRAFTAVALAVVLALVAAACGGSRATARSPFRLGPISAPAAITWPAPADPMARARAAGLVPETAERLRFHVHSHLDVFVNGARVVVPAGLGIDTHAPSVHAFSAYGAPSYGGIAVPCDQACISPLHTHDVSGVLHTESATSRYNTLGQLFTEWGVRLDARCVATYCAPRTPISVAVDGRPFHGDPRSIALSDREEIAVVVGTPPARVPVTADFGGA